ncbi:MAG: hypothetical protein IJT75_04255 [Bacteroidaceae bacterium]|nr:hypothetical protein [Bacteroidaceae bacterium]
MKHKEIPTFFWLGVKFGAFSVKKHLKAVPNERKWQKSLVGKRKSCIFAVPRYKFWLSG